MLPFTQIRKGCGCSSQCFQHTQQVERGCTRRLTVLLRPRIRENDLLTGAVDRQHEKQLFGFVESTPLAQVSRQNFRYILPLLIEQQRVLSDESGKSAVYQAGNNDHTKLQTSRSQEVGNHHSLPVQDADWRSTGL